MKKPRFPSLETMIKLILLMMGVVLTIAIMGMRLYRDHSASMELALAEVRRMETTVAAMNFSDVAELSAFASRNLAFWGDSPRRRDVVRPREIYHSLESRNGLRLTLRLDEEAIWETLLDANRTQLVMAFLVLIVSVQVASLLAYSVTSPLRRLAWGFKQLASDRSVRLPANHFAADELVMITEAFNEMAARLDEWHDIQKRIVRMDRLAALGEMVSGVAHEIRNPLASMRIHLDLLYQSQEGDEVRRARLSVFEEELARLERKLNLFLDFARHRSNRREAIDPGELLEWVASMVGKSAEERGVRVDLACDPYEDGESLFFGDSDELRQALLNLALNGIQAIEPDEARKGVLSLSVSRARDRLVFAVEDSGCGVPEEVGARLFEPFVTSRSGGTGLGLAIARKCVEDHGGTLDYSTSPSGSRFFMVLPLYPSKEAYEDDHPLDC